MPGAADMPGQSDSPEPPRPLGQSELRLQQRLDSLPDGHPSSPRDEDGSWRSPAVNLKDLELPIEDAPTETEAPPSTPDQAPPPPDATSEAWRKEVPGFQAAWQNHLERWPETDRPPAGFDDQTGVWRSEAGHPLTREQLDDTGDALNRVKEAEVKVTGMMKSVEAAVSGGTLVGLGNCLKGEDRFREKIAYEASLKPDRPIANIIDRMPDKIRYTCQFTPDRYADGYGDTCTQLTDRGNELLLCKNLWKEQEYKGINTRWLSSEGSVFEVQFHTPDSFAAKQLTHPAYERLRLANESDTEVPSLEEFQRNVTAKVEIPDRAETISEYRREGY